jgi:signal transduction histidine kinase
VLLLAAVALLAVLLLPRGVAAVAVGAAVLLLALLAARFARRASAPAAALDERAAPLAERGPAPVESLLALIEPLPDGVVLLDDELLVLAANPALARLVRQPLEGMLGASLIRATRDYGLTATARERPAETRELQLTGGETVRAGVAPLDPPLLGGRATLALVVEDVTALRAAQRARSDLVANLSHELRTPIAGARAIAETLQAAGDDGAERERFLGLLVDELERMSELVQRMLRLAQLESEREPLELEAVSPAVLLETAARRFRPVAGRRDVRVEIETATPEAVRANPERAGEVLANLLENALRHSPPGARVGLAALAEDGPDGAAVRFEVRDEGPGILPQERERVFERFYTGDAAREAGSHTGLGLAIARQLVQQQGGRIWVADRTPGATLCFTLGRAEGAPTTPSR